MLQMNALVCNKHRRRSEAACGAKFNCNTRTSLRKRLYNHALHTAMRVLASSRVAPSVLSHSKSAPEPAL